MKNIVFALGLLLTLASCKYSSHPAENANQPAANVSQAKKCEECVAQDFPGADSFRMQYCTARSTCRNNSPTLIDLIANDQCRNSNTDKCTGDCPRGNRCDGIYERGRSRGLTVTGAIVPGGNCPATQVNCDVTLTVPAGGLLACKCSCNPTS